MGPRLAVYTTSCYDYNQRRETEVGRRDMLGELDAAAEIFALFSERKSLACANRRSKADMVASHAHYRK